MSVTIRGDFAKLRAWAQRVDGAARAKTLNEISDNLAEEALDLVAEGFSKQTDPYGKAWKSKKEPDGRSILVGKTARLRRGWHRKRVSAKGFRIGPSVNYAEYHQGGTRHMVARKMVPSGGSLPPKWARAFEGIAKKFLDQQFSG